jgi:hypothetical protein
MKNKALTAALAIAALATPAASQAASWAQHYRSESFTAKQAAAKPYTVNYPNATSRVPAKYVGFLQDGHCLLVQHTNGTPTLYCLHVQVDTYIGP